MSTYSGLRSRGETLYILAGPAMIILFAIGVIPLAGFFPPPSPTSSAQVIADMYRDDLTSIRVGCFLMMFAFALLVPWGGALTATFRRIETGPPMRTYGQIACLAVSVLIIELIPMTWAVAAFRPDDTSPDITRALNDFAWFLLLFTWPPFTVWCMLIADTILGDKAQSPTFPRWLGYFNIWCGLLFIPAGLILFFKTGPFAFNGVLAFYIPVAVFFIWMLTMSASLLKVVRTDSRPELQMSSS